MNETLPPVLIPTGNRLVKLLDPPRHYPLDLLAEPEAAFEARDRLAFLVQLHTKHPDKHFMEFEASPDCPVAQAVTRLWHAGHVRVIVWRDLDTNESGAAVSARNIVQLPKGDN